MTHSFGTFRRSYTLRRYASYFVGSSWLLLTFLPGGLRGAGGRCRGRRGDVLTDLYGSLHQIHVAAASGVISTVLVHSNSSCVVPRASYTSMYRHFHSSNSLERRHSVATCSAASPTSCIGPPKGLLQVCAQPSRLFSRMCKLRFHVLSLLQSCTDVTILAGGRCYSDREPVPLVFGSR